jgi:hypothetical protein
MTGDRDPAAEATLHELLLRVAGSLPDRVLADARELLAEGKRAQVVQMVAYSAVSQPFQLDADEIRLLRAELTLAGVSQLAAVLEEVRGERQPEPGLFLSSLPQTREEAEAAMLPLDLTNLPGGPKDLDAADQALLRIAGAQRGIRALWRAWRMPPAARPWDEPVRVYVVSVDGSVAGLADLSARLRRVVAGAGDAGAQVEVCWGGLNVPFYQTLARSCGALLWAARPPVPLVTARVFDGVDPVRGPWFVTNRPVLPDRTGRDALVARLRSVPIVVWSTVNMIDVLAPDRGEVVPLHLRTDGTWIWSDAVAYYLEHHHLAPDPELVTHLTGTAGAEPLDEISLHRALVHLSRPLPEDVVWYASGTDPSRTLAASKGWP